MPVAWQIDFRDVCIGLQQSADVLDQVESYIRDSVRLQPAPDDTPLQRDWLNTQLGHRQVSLARSSAGSKLSSNASSSAAIAAARQIAFRIPRPNSFSKNGMIWWRMRLRVDSKVALLVSSRKRSFALAMYSSISAAPDAEQRTNDCEFRRADSVDRHRLASSDSLPRPFRGKDSSGKFRRDRPHDAQGKLSGNAGDAPPRQKTRTSPSARPFRSIASNLSPAPHVASQLQRTKTPDHRPDASQTCASAAAERPRRR